MKLVLPLPPNRANDRKNWKVVLREKKAYWDTLNTLVAAGKLPKPPGKAPQKAVLRSTYYVWSIMDRGNSVARLKIIEDWLKGWGYITDDSPKHLELEWPTQVVDRKNPRIEIEITPEAQLLLHKEGNPV